MVLVCDYDELRRVVDDLRVTGFPEPLTYGEIARMATDEQKELLSSLLELISEREKLLIKIPVQKPSQSWVHLCQIETLVRKKLQIAIANGLVGVKLVQDNAPLFGAIPHPDTKWNYYRMPEPNSPWLCWKCGGQVEEKNEIIHCPCADAV